MGRYEYPCPSCAQKQTTRAEGAPVAHSLCPSCAEKDRACAVHALQSGAAPTAVARYTAAKALYPDDGAFLRWSRDEAARETFTG